MAIPVLWAGAALVRGKLTAALRPASLVGNEM